MTIPFFSRIDCQTAAMPAEWCRVPIGLLTTTLQKSLFYRDIFLYKYSTTKKDGLQQRREPERLGRRLVGNPATFAMGIPHTFPRVYEVYVCYYPRSGPCSLDWGYGGWGLTSYTFQVTCGFLLK
jgi:hypothetical protein